MSSFYTWEVPGKMVSVRLDFSAIDRMLLEIMRGFGAIPRRGAEVGGILLGTVELSADKAIVHISDFEPVPCDHRRGPSFLLSEPDAARFDEAARRAQFSPDKKIYAVGMYRSHTREGMGLGPDDLNLYGKYFTDPSAVFLLVKPYATKVSMAGFFIREDDGSIRSDATYQEFPFRRKELGGGSSGNERSRGETPGHTRGAQFNLPGYGTDDDSGSGRDRDYMPTTADELAAALASMPVPPANVEPDSAVARFRRTNVWIPLSFIFLLLGVLIGFQAAIAYRPAKDSNLMKDAYVLSLSASRTGDNLHVRWDRTAYAVKNAQRGVLNITDGTYSTTVDLDIAQLQNPSVFYRNMSSTVRFKLEVFTKERNSVAEVLEWSK